MKIETKYNIGQEVWGLFSGDSIVNGVISAIEIYGCNDILYNIRVDLQSPSLCLSEKNFSPPKKNY